MMCVWYFYVCMYVCSMCVYVYVRVRVRIVCVRACLCVCVCVQSERRNKTEHCICMSCLHQHNIITSLPLHTYAYIHTQCVLCVVVLYVSFYVVLFICVVRGGSEFVYYPAVYHTQVYTIRFTTLLLGMRFVHSSHIQTHIYTYRVIHTHTYVQMYTFTHAYTHVHIHTLRTQIHSVYTYMYSTHADTQTRTHTHNTHTHTHVHIHTQPHTRTHTIQ